MLIKTHPRIKLFRQYIPSLIYKQLENTQWFLFVNKLLHRRAAQSVCKIMVKSTDSGAMLPGSHPFSATFYLCDLGQVA